MEVIMKVFKTLGWGAFFIFFSTALLAYVNAAVGAPVPDAEIYLEQKPDDESIFMGVTDEGGEFDFGNNIYGFQAGLYQLKFSLKNVKNIDYESLKKMTFLIYFKIGKIGPDGKEIIYYYAEVRIEGRNVCLDKKNVALCIILPYDIVFGWGTTKTNSNKSGFAVGGFSLS